MHKRCSVLLLYFMSLPVSLCQNESTNLIQTAPDWVRAGHTVASAGDTVPGTGYV